MDHHFHITFRSRRCLAAAPVVVLRSLFSTVDWEPLAAGFYTRVVNPKAFSVEKSGVPLGAKFAGAHRTVRLPAFLLAVPAT